MHDPPAHMQLDEFRLAGIQFALWVRNSVQTVSILSHLYCVFCFYLVFLPAISCPAPQQGCETSIQHSETWRKGSRGFKSSQPDACHVEAEITHKLCTEISSSSLNISTLDGDLATPQGEINGQKAMSWAFALGNRNF